MTAPTPTLTRARAIVALMSGEPVAVVAERHGVTPQTLAGWRRSLETDEELRVAVGAAARHALGGWRPRVAELVVVLVGHVEGELRKPGALDAESAIGAIRSLVAVLGQVDLLARRHGLDLDQLSPRGEKELDS